MQNWTFGELMCRLSSFLNVLSVSDSTEDQKLQIIFFWTIYFYICITILMMGSVFILFLDRKLEKILFILIDKSGFVEEFF